MREAFFTKTKEALEVIITKDVDKELHALIWQGTSAEDLKKPVLPKDLPHLYSAALPHELSEAHSLYFIHLYQALRLVALVHDVGHPPFSHVAENALARIDDYLGISNTKLINGKPPEGLKDLTKLFKEFVKGEVPFHEALGTTLSKILFETYIKERKAARANDEELYFLLLQKYLVLSILNEDTPFFKSLHKIVDGQLDSDRLDYVQRDLCMSGLAKEPLRIDRLLRSFTLIRYPATGASFSFVPSIRAIQNLEEFYRQRFQLYKYVIYHHRVVKFDGLLEHCISDLAKKYIAAIIGSLPAEQKETANDQSLATKRNNPLLLRSDIAGLWQARRF